MLYELLPASIAALLATVRQCHRRPRLREVPGALIQHHTFSWKWISAPAELEWLDFLVHISQATGPKKAEAFCWPTFWETRWCSCGRTPCAGRGRHRVGADQTVLRANQPVRRHGDRICSRPPGRLTVTGQVRRSTARRWPVPPSRPGRRRPRPLRNQDPAGRPTNLRGRFRPIAGGFSTVGVRPAGYQSPRWALANCSRRKGGIPCSLLPCIPRRGARPQGARHAILDIEDPHAYDGGVRRRRIAAAPLRARRRGWLQARRRPSAGAG